jgi:hypothetical protein
VPAAYAQWQQQAAKSDHNFQSSKSLSRQVMPLAAVSLTPPTRSRPHPRHPKYRLASVRACANLRHAGVHPQPRTQSDLVWALPAAHCYSRGRQGLGKPPRLIALHGRHAGRLHTPGGAAGDLATVQPAGVTSSRHVIHTDTCCSYTQTHTFRLQSRRSVREVVSACHTYRSFTRGRPAISHQPEPTQVLTWYCCVCQDSPLLLQLQPLALKTVGEPKTV